MDFRRVEQTLMLSFTPDVGVKRRRLTTVIAHSRAKGISKIRTQLKRIRVARDFFVSENTKEDQVCSNQIYRQLIACNPFIPTKKMLLTNIFCE